MITAGEVLKSKRESLRKTLDTVSLDTKIQKRFLEYIEGNKFSHFDSEVFLTGFIKIYAKYLGLDTNKILALYRRSNPSVKSKKEIVKKERTLKTRSKNRKTITPKTLATTSIALFLLSILGYIAFQIYKFQSPPIISILEPSDNTVTTFENITVKGNTQHDSIVEINEKPVSMDDDGNFEKEITLIEGTNIITVKARKNKNNTLETVKILKITYSIEEKSEGEKEERIQENSLLLKIENSPTWIKLDIDNENKLSQVLEPGEMKFEIHQNLYIITGRVNDTHLYWGDETVEWKLTQKTGVAELSCNIVEQSLVCE